MISESMKLSSEVLSASVAFLSPDRSTAFINRLLTGQMIIFSSLSGRHHWLRGSGSTVVTMTSKVSGKTEI